MIKESQRVKIGSIINLYNEIYIVAGFAKNGECQYRSGCKECRSDDGKIFLLTAPAKKFATKGYWKHCWYVVELDRPDTSCKIICE